MKRLLLALVISAGCAAGTRASFEDVETGARGTALGGSMVAVGDDMNALFYNPAGITGVIRKELLASYQKLYHGLSDGSNIGRNLFAFGMPLKLWNRYAGVGAIGWDELSLTGYYSERKITLGYGYSAHEDTWVGANINFLTIGYGSDAYTAINPVFDNGYSKSAASLDFGFLRKYDDIDLGVSIQHINEPEMGLKYSNKIPRRLNLGMAYRTDLTRWMLALTTFEKDWRLKTGIERVMFKRLLADRVVFRGGFNIGSREYRNVGLGFGFREPGYRIDYAFLYPLSGIAETYGSHQIALSLVWGPAYSRSIANATQSGQLAPGSAGMPGVFPVPGTSGAVSDAERARALGLLEEARRRIAAGRYSEGMDILREASAILPDDPQVKDGFDRMYPVVGISSSAAQNIKRDDIMRMAVLKYFDNNPDAVPVITYGHQLWPKDRELNSVRDIIIKAFPDAAANLRILPGINVVDQMLQDALDMIRSSRFVQAVGTLEKVLEIEPRNITALTRMGSAYWAMDKKSMARTYWRRVLDLDPANNEVREFMKGN